MFQVVATVERDPMYVLKMALQSVQGSILENIANEAKISYDKKEHECFQYIIVNCKSNLQLENLLNSLKIKGVCGLQIYSENDADLKLSESKFGKRFYYCNGVFKT